MVHSITSIIICCDIIQWTCDNRY